MKRIPDHLRYTTVDEAIECLPISEDTRGELLELAPDAYDYDIHNGATEPGQPGFREFPPEPSSKGGVYLKKIWARLSPAARADLGRDA